MNQDTQEEISLILAMLRNSLVKNYVSIGVSGRNILFFDTDQYVKSGKMDGFKISMDNLVK